MPFSAGGHMAPQPSLRLPEGTMEGVHHEKKGRGTVRGGALRWGEPGAGEVQGQTVWPEERVCGREGGVRGLSGATGQVGPLGHCSSSRLPDAGHRPSGSATSGVKVGHKDARPFHAVALTLQLTSRMSGIGGWVLTPSPPLIPGDSAQHLPLCRPQFPCLKHEGVPKDGRYGSPLLRG